MAFTTAAAATVFVPVERESLRALTQDERKDVLDARRAFGPVPAGKRAYALAGRPLNSNGTTPVDESFNFAASGETDKHFLGYTAEIVAESQRAFSVAVSGITSMHVDRKSFGELLGLEASRSNDGGLQYEADIHSTLLSDLYASPETGGTQMDVHISHALPTA